MIAHIFYGVLFLCLGYLLLRFARQLQRLSKSQNRILAKLDNLTNEHMVVKGDQEVLANRLKKVTKLVCQLQSKAAELDQTQQTIQSSEPESKIYTRAVKMINLGAGIEEVMRECELPRAEAELLLSLHQGR